MIHVLIVEDDPMVAELNKSYLNRIEGFKLAGVVANGQEALDFLEKNLVSLLLLDVFMPQLDGLSLLQKILGSVMCLSRAITKPCLAIQLRCYRRASASSTACRCWVLATYIRRGSGTGRGL